MLFLLAFLLVAGGCSARSEPELALLGYADAVNNGRCSEALTFLSARTVYSLDSLRVRPQRKWEPIAVEQYYCNKIAFENCRLNKTTLAEEHGDIAKVSLQCGRMQDSFLPGFPSPFLKYELRETDLVREEGRWFIVDPLVIKIVEIREQEERMRDEAMHRRSQNRP